MKNLNVYLTLESVGYLKLNFPNGRKLVQRFVTDDFKFQPGCLYLEVFDKELKKAILITIPNDEGDEVYVHIIDSEDIDSLYKDAPVIGPV